MAAYIAVLLTKTSFTAGHVAQAGDVLRGWSNSETEAGVALLANTLHLARPAGANACALSKPTDTYRAHFASGAFDGSFEEILQAYLGFVAWNQDVTTRRAWFTPPPDHQHILTPLADLGYLDSENGHMRWTDKAGPAMLCAGAWNPELQCNIEVKEWQREKDARRIAESLPGDLVFLALNDPGAAFWKVHERIGGEAWYDTPDKVLIERVIELVRAKSSGSG